MINDKSPHILNSASNLLGFCLVILTSLKVTNYSQNTLIDEFTGVSSLLLMISCTMSFLSIRSSVEKNAARFERTADLFFLCALFCIFLTVSLISVNVLL